MHILLNGDLPTWLTAIGTIAAVCAAVGQTVWNDTKKIKEDRRRSANARLFIDSMLTDYKAQFVKYSNFKYELNDKDLINEGELSELYNLFFMYIESYIRETTTDYIVDLKFAIKNVSVQTDSHTIEDISERFKAVNTIKISISEIYDRRGDDSVNYSEEELKLHTRSELIKIDDALQILKEDLTDSDKN